MLIPCQNCGHMNDSENEFCGKCGNAIDKSVRFKSEVMNDLTTEPESEPKKKFTWSKRNKIIVSTFAILSVIPLAFICRTIVIQTVYSGFVDIEGEQQSDYQVVFTFTAEDGKIKILDIRISYEDYSYRNRPIDLVLDEYETYVVHFNLPLSYDPFNGQVFVHVDLFGGRGTFTTFSVHSN